MTILLQVRKSFQRYFGLTDAELMIILNYFLYGKKLTFEERQVIENVMNSEKYLNLLERLIKNYAEGEMDPKKFIETDVPVLNAITSYLLWRKYGSGNGRTAEQGITGLDSKTIELFKVKYMKILLTQYRFGQMTPMLDWPGKQIHHVPGVDFGTDGGQCSYVGGFVHNEIPWDYSKPFKAWGSYPGEANGLTMMLDAEVFDTGISESQSIGLQISIFYYNDVPIMSNNGINIDVGTFTKLGVAAKAIETSQTAKDTIIPERRGCFFDDEIRLMDIHQDTGGRYEMTNCLFQAAADQIRERCKCDPGHYEIKSNICVGTDVACLKEVESELGKWDEVIDTLTNTTKKCMAACETAYYSDTMVSTQTYPSKESFMYTKESCVLARKLISTCEDERRLSLVEWYPNLCNQIEVLQRTNSFCRENSWSHASLNNRSDFDFSEFSSTMAKYAKDNIALVKVFMREPFAEVLKVNVQTTTLDFISNIGGLMGLCMGFSLVTLAEILYHVLDAAWMKLFPAKTEIKPFVRRDNRRIAAFENSWNENGNGKGHVNGNMIAPAW